MDAKIHSDLRVFDLEIGGAVVVPAEGITEQTKEESSPLGLTMWASRVDTGRW